MMYSLAIATMITQGESKSIGIDADYISITIAVVLMFVLISMYHWNLVYRARKYMIQDVLSDDTRKAVEKKSEPVESRNLITTFP